MNASFTACIKREAFVVSFPVSARVLSWALLNGGFSRADHLVNHHVRGSDVSFCAQPNRWLEQATLELGLQGTVVAMATAVEMKDLIRVSMRGTGIEVTCFATVGCGNALSVGDPAIVVQAKPTATQLHTINLILTVRPGLRDEALVEAIQIATEGRVRALYEAGIQSSLSSLTATGTGTDCIAIVSLDNENSPYCGKHTQFGELIGRAAYTAVSKGIAVTLHR